MTASTLLKIVLPAIMLAVLLGYQLHPYRTGLPPESPDLTSVEKQLARLSEQDRELVEAYVKRSNGDVLPAQLARSDSPFTARTFGDAIELEKQWRKKLDIDHANNEAFAARREARLAPLKAILQVSLDKAEIISKDEYFALLNPGRQTQWQRADKTPVFVSHIRLQNLSDETITHFTGALKATDSRAPLPMDICWLDNGQTLEPYSDVVVYCAVSQFSGTERDFIADTTGRFQVLWTPQHIRLASGRELDGGN